jgi:HrpA-like RNA helicase
LFTTRRYTEPIFRSGAENAELGISNFEEFDFISKPPKSGIAGAIDILNLLDALSEDRRLSKTGELMCAFPLLPRLSRMIVESMLRYPEVIHETLVAASFLSTMSPYVLPPGEELEARKAHHAFRIPWATLSPIENLRCLCRGGGKTRFCEHNYLDERTMREILEFGSSWKSSFRTWASLFPGEAPSRIISAR